jgi:hypothetical protein
MPLDICTVIPDLVVLDSNMFVQIVDASSECHTLGADDDPIEVASMIRMNHITSKHVFADVGSVEDGDVRKCRSPIPVTKADGADLPPFSLPIETRIPLG